MTDLSTGVKLLLPPVAWEELDYVAATEGRTIGQLIKYAVRRPRPDFDVVGLRPADSVQSVLRRIEVEVDALRECSVIASRRGCSLNRVVEDLVRRDLASRLLTPLPAGQDRAIPELSETEALDLAYAELDAVRQEASRQDG